MTSAQFETLFSQWYAPLCRVAYRMVRDKDAAEDLVQEVFVKYWERNRDFNADEHPKAYLYKAVYNSSLNFLTAQKRTVHTESERWEDWKSSGQTDGPLLAQDVETAVENGLSDLPPGCKTVFLMSRNEEMTYTEIADNLGISIKTVEAQMSKALRILRQHLLPFLSAILLIIWTSIKNI